MGKKYIIDETTLTEIANAIREKRWTNTQIGGASFASEIRKIDKGVVPYGTITITQNGEYSVRDFALADVKVETKAANFKYIKGTTVPNSGYVEKVYLNTALSPKEVVDIIEKANLDFVPVERNTSVYPVFGNTSLPLAVVIMRIMNNDGSFSYGIVEFFNLSKIWFESSIGWNDEDVIEINGELLDIYEGMLIGTQNDKINTLFSITPFINSNTAVVKYTEGTFVPNEWYLEKIYFNDNLSVDEVVNTLKTLTFYQTLFLDNPIYPILFSSDGTPVVFAVKATVSDTDVYEINIVYDLAKQVYDRIFLSYVSGDGSTAGWHKTECEIDKELINDYYGIPIGTENNKIINLVSTAPFINEVQAVLDGAYNGASIEIVENGTIDVNSLLDNKKLPLEINVNVEGGGVNSLKKLLDYTKSTYYLFQGEKMPKDLNGYINYNDTANVTDMTYMFYEGSTETIPLLNTSNVTDMSHMFHNSYIKEIPLLDTSKVEYMGYMFRGSRIKTIPLLDTRNVKDMSHMFNQSEISVFPQIDTSNVENMNYMFYTTSVTNIKLNTLNVTTIDYIFKNCSDLEKVELSYWNFDKTSASFSSCSSLKTIIIRGFGEYYAINTNIFNDCYHILGIQDATYNPNGDKDGYIYVPRSKVDTLKSATNWSSFASQIRALEDYTVDGTTTGELDETKI